MEWLIGIGRSKLGNSSNSGTGKSRTHHHNDEHLKAYMNDKTNLGHVLHNLSKEQLHDIVPVPTGVDLNEWLATNTLSFFNHISLIYDTLDEYCTALNCTTVSTGAVMSYTWVDDKGKKMRLSAPQYIEIVILNIQKYITDENVFPTKYDMTFPSNFVTIIKKIFRFLFHIISHIYQSHYEHISTLQELTVLNTLFIHFMYFQSEHNLLESKEVQPLEDLIKSLCL